MLGAFARFMRTTATTRLTTIGRNHAMTTNPTPASVLRQAEAITGQASEFLILKELVAELKVLVEIANAAEVKA